MKKLSEIQNNFSLKISNMSGRVSYLKKQIIDWNIYLPSKEKFLQRSYVWPLEQKRELIWSILIRRNIPHLSIISSISKSSEIFLIIDGKQRLSTIFDFINDKFTIEIENEEYLFSSLPEEYQREIMFFNLKYYLVNEESEGEISDDQKIAWFKFINFSGTPQEKEHLNNL